MQQAFDRRSEWDAISTDVAAEDSVGLLSRDESLFYWGEYEGIDWEKVHSGECCLSPNCKTCVIPSRSEACVLFLRQAWRPPEQSTLTLPEILWLCSSGDQHACCYCFRKGLIRKAHLCHNTKKWAAKHPEGWLAKSVPESFIFELDDIDYIEEALCDVPEVRFSKRVMHAAVPPMGHGQDHV